MDPAMVTTINFDGGVVAHGNHQQSRNVGIVSGSDAALNRKSSATDYLHQNYTWVGNHWVPPSGIPMYSAADMRALFGRYNVLFIGDSTMRRSYATLYAILNETHPVENILVPQVDGRSIIDRNKAGWLDEPCVGRSTASSDKEDLSFLRSSSLCRSTSMNKKFDYEGRYCFKELSPILATLLWSNPTLNNHGNIEQRYDILVVGTGVWEAVRPWDCEWKGSRANLNHTDWILDELSKVASPSLHVIVRTLGFSSDHDGDAEVMAMNSRIREFISSQPHMTCVDWGTQVFPRSFVPNRINGDIPLHYGFQARFLFAHMLTHTLLLIQAEGKLFEQRIR